MEPSTLRAEGSLPLLATVRFYQTELLLPRHEAEIAFCADLRDGKLKATAFRSILVFRRPPAARPGDVPANT